MPSALLQKLWEVEAAEEEARLASSGWSDALDYHPGRSVRLSVSSPEPAYTTTTIKPGAEDDSGSCFDTDQVPVGDAAISPGKGSTAAGKGPQGSAAKDRGADSEAWEEDEEEEVGQGGSDIEEDEEKGEEGKGQKEKGKQMQAIKTPAGAPRPGAAGDKTTQEGSSPNTPSQPVTAGRAAEAAAQAEATAGGSPGTPDLEQLVHAVRARDGSALLDLLGLR